LSLARSEARRNKLLWDTWSSAVLSQKSGFLPIHYTMFRRIFLSSSSAAGSLRARSLMIRSFNRPLRAFSALFGWNTLGWFVVTEGIISFLFVSTIYYIGAILFTVCSWWLDHGTLASFPLVILLDVVSPIWTTTLDLWRMGESLLFPTSPIAGHSWLTVLWIGLSTLLYNSCYQHWDDIIAVVGPNLPLTWDPAIIFGIPAGIFYKFGIYPVGELISYPYLWVLGHSPAFSGLTWPGDLVLWFESLIAGIENDRFYWSHGMWLDGPFDYISIIDSEDFDWSPYKKDLSLDSSLPTNDWKDEHSEYFETPKPSPVDVVESDDDGWVVVNPLRDGPWYYRAVGLCLHHPILFSIPMGLLVTRLAGSGVSYLFS
jgi:hypothetical protein